ncbi:MAG TPA: DUF1045 domain-containing protein, partial [Paracoccaceae bacterium]|nr:DUF1045 domain-containing protein [Paracoccaceae bacterium]
MERMKRFGIYYLPPAESALGRFGAEWLGWDAELGRALRPADLPELPLDWERITEAPWHYGFHGTLKPPFRLAAGRRGEELAEAVAEFARGVAPFEMPPLAPRVGHGFLSLRPSAACPALDALAAACMEMFEPFRAPPDADELARRRQAGLTARQEAMLVRWGYPYVMEEFHFHLTLTGNLGDLVAAQ